MKSKYLGILNLSATSCTVQERWQVSEDEWKASISSHVHGSVTDNCDTRSVTMSANSTAQIRRYNPNAHLRPTEKHITYKSGRSRKAGSIDKFL